MIWKVLKSSYAFLSPWLRVRKDHVKMPSGVEMDDFFVIESNDWVNVIAVTNDNKIIIEEQYRHGIGQVCFELPAGSVSEGENPLEACKRELMEETGYAGGDWRHFYTSAPNSSGMNNYCHTFLATNVQKVDEPHQEETEDIRVHFKAKTDIRTLLTNGSIIEAVMQAPLWKYLNEDKWQ